MVEKHVDTKCVRPLRAWPKAVAIFLCLGVAGGIAALGHPRREMGTITPTHMVLGAPSSEGAASQVHAEVGQESRDAAHRTVVMKRDRPAADRHGQAGGSAHAWVPTVPADALEAASVFRKAQGNAFFDEEAFARSFTLQQGSEGIEALRSVLKTTDTLAALPDDVDFMKDAPPEVLDRMSVLDMIGILAKDNPAALGVLVDIVKEPLNDDLPPAAAKVLLGEKYDAFVELARHDWATAASTFSALRNEQLKDAMRPALIGGLVDIGTSPEDAMKMVSSI